MLENHIGASKKAGLTWGMLAILEVYFYLYSWLLDTEVISNVRIIQWRNPRPLVGEEGCYTKNTSGYILHVRVDP